jgi:hypothetical protein
MKQTQTGEWYLADDWHIEDVRIVRPDLDDDQCIHVLEILTDAFDANDGITWSGIEYTAYRLYPTTEEDDDENDLDGEVCHD